MIADHCLIPMELGHLPYRKNTFEDDVGQRSLDRYGKKKWKKYVSEVISILCAALQPDDVVLGGDNTSKLEVIPEGVRLGSNDNAFKGEFKLWEGLNET